MHVHCLPADKPPKQRSKKITKPHSTQLGICDVVHLFSWYSLRKTTTFALTFLRSMSRNSAANTSSPPLGGVPFHLVSILRSAGCTASTSSGRLNAPLKLPPAELSSATSIFRLNDSSASKR